MFLHPAVSGVNKTDRERLLAQLASDLSSILVKHTHGPDRRDSRGYEPGSVYLDHYREGFQVGDLVIGMCGAIGYVVTVGTGSDNWVIRLLGTNEIQRWSNEGFVAVRGLCPSAYLEGDAYLMKMRVQACDGKGPMYWTRVFFERLDGDDAIVGVRIRWTTDKSWEMRVPKYKQYLRRKSLRKYLETQIAKDKITPGHPYYEHEKASEAARAQYYAEQAKAAEEQIAAGVLMAAAATDTNPDPNQ